MEQFKGDKRTKAYKEWKKQWLDENKQKAAGLGDTVEKITKATGIKKAVKFLVGEDCGCDERKEKLNKLFGYKKPECLTEDEYNFLTNFYKRHTGSLIQGADKRCLIKTHNRVLHTRYNENTSCAICVRNVYNGLKKLIENYG